MRKHSCPAENEDEEACHDDDFPNPTLVSRMKPKPTILSVFLEISQDPSLAAFRVPVLASLVRALLNHGGTRGTREAQMYVRSFIVDTIQDKLPSFPMNQLLPEPLQTVRFSRLQARLALIKEWMIEIPECGPSLIPSICSILTALDNLEINTVPFVTEKRYETPSTLITPFATGSCIVDYLHDDFTDGSNGIRYHGETAETNVDDGGCLRDKPFFIPRTKVVKFQSISVKKVLRQSTPSDSREDLRRKRRARQQLRDKSMHRLFQIGLSRKSYDQLHISKLLQQAASSEYPHSICWAVVLTLIRSRCAQEEVENEETNIIDEAAAAPDALEFLTNIVWNQHEHSPSFYVGFYFEILSEFTCFDNAEFLWRTLEPFITYVCKRMEQEPEDVEKEEEQPTAPAPRSQAILEPVYRRAFANFLTRRGALLKDLKLFRSFTAQLSAVFGEERDWLGVENEYTTQEHRLVVNALRETGILGTFSSNDHPEEKQIVSKAPRPLGSQYLRQANQWRDVKFQRDALFSCLSLVNGVPPEPKKAKKPARPLDSDVLTHVFSYLGYKRLVQMRTICKEWHKIAEGNRLWHGLYRNQFPVLREDLDAWDESRPWMNLFRIKHAAKRYMLHKRSATGQHYHICRFTGCSRVMLSRSISKHERQGHMIKAAPKKTRARKRKYPAGIAAEKPVSEGQESTKRHKASGGLGTSQKHAGSQPQHETSSEPPAMPPKRNRKQNVKAAAGSTNKPC